MQPCLPRNNADDAPHVDEHSRGHCSRKGRCVGCRGWCRWLWDNEGSFQSGINTSARGWDLITCNMARRVALETVETPSATMDMTPVLTQGEQTYMNKVKELEVRFSGKPSKKSRASQKTDGQSQAETSQKTRESCLSPQ